MYLREVQYNIYDIYDTMSQQMFMCQKWRELINGNVGYMLSTNIVDNPVEAVDMFHKCHIRSSTLSVCIVNNHCV